MRPRDDFDSLTTEGINPNAVRLDALDARQFVDVMNAEDHLVAAAVARDSGAIAAAIDVIAERLRHGGRLVYVGAGTSGRLGVLDAVECAPTFCARPGQVLGLIAGGDLALTSSVEGAEDDSELGERDVRQAGVSRADVVVGIAASGRTPYVLGAIGAARAVGAFTIGLSCNLGSELGRHADLAITPVVGPEVLSGSTRLKAGTATKMVLNMLSTGAFVRLGKAYGHLMIDVQPSNEKLRARARRIVRQVTGVDDDAAAALLARCGGEVKTALVAQRLGVSPEAARQRLVASAGAVRAALGET